MQQPQTQLDWDLIFDHLAEKHYVFIDHFISVESCTGLRGAISEYREKAAFHVAGIGTGDDMQINREIRTDRIHWVDRSDNHPAVHVFLDEVVELMKRINRECFLSLSGYEFHFAHYPPGSYYKRHLDQFDKHNNRLISVICYLNEDWKPGDGGELKVFLKDGEEIIEPIEGRLILMRSNILEHEVLITNKDRLSITGWLCHHPPGLGFLDGSL